MVKIEIILFFKIIKSAQLLSRYDMTYPNKKYTTAKDRTIAKTNIDDCARACNDEPSFDCQSFDFCYTSGDCRLSKSGITSDANELVTTVECDVYESKIGVSNFLII